MFPDARTLWRGAAIAAALVTGLIGCEGSIGGNAGPPPDTTVIESATQRVKFKSQGRFVRDLAAGLELQPGEVCQELGLYDCYEEAHRITLGGVEPYQRGIRDPLPVAPVTAPIAVDRVALSACATRVDLDFDAPRDALVFGELALGDVNQATLRTAAGNLYDRLLRRDASSDELDALVAFHDDAVEVVTAEDSGNPVREWAVASCFAVATSMEGLFY